MEIKDSILQELQHEAESTKKMIDRLPDDKADWQPHTKSMTLKRLANHIVDLQTWFNNTLQKDSYDFANDHVTTAYKNFKDLGNIMAEKVNQNIEFVKKTDNDFWNKEFTFKSGDHIVMKAPRIVAYRTMLTNHLIHHRGQLSTYLRALDVPVPGMYGPSADEK